MEALNRALAQISDLFKSMTPGARLTAAGLLVLIVISSFYLVNHQVSGPDAYLLEEETFSPAKISQMRAAFGKAGLNSYEVEGGRIRIPRGQQDKYMAALIEADAVPMSFGQVMDKTLSKSSNMFAPKTQLATAINNAKQMEVSRLLEAMEGVEQANVIFDQKDKIGFSGQALATASVSVKMKDAAGLDAKRASHIRNFVVHSFAGLKSENVAVQDMTTGQSYHAPANGSPGAGSENIWAQNKQEYDVMWEAKIRNALSYIPGVIVAANSEVDTELHHEELKTSYDKPIDVESSTTKTQRPVFAPTAGGGQPGVVAQQGLNQKATVVQAAASQAATPEETSETNKVVSKVSEDQLRSAIAPFTAKNVRVNIGIPTAWIIEVWRGQQPAEKQNSQPTQAQIDAVYSEQQKSITDRVDVLLPELRASQDGHPRIQCALLPAVKLPDAPKTATTDRLIGWLSQNWTSLGMGGLALMALSMLRSFVREIPVRNIPAESAAPHAASHAPQLSIAATPDDDDDEKESARARLKRRTSSGPSLRDELTDLVKEDPDAAVSVLKSWIGNVS